TMLSRTLLHTQNAGSEFSPAARARRMTRQPRRTFRPHWDLFEDRTLLSLITWTGSGGDNNWDTPANWSSSAVPTVADDVVIDSSFSSITITHSASSSDSVNSINSQAAIAITGGTLSIANSSMINNALIVNATLTGAGNLVVNGLLSWSGYGA